MGLTTTGSVEASYPLPNGQRLNLHLAGELWSVRRWATDGRSYSPLGEPTKNELKARDRLQFELFRATRMLTPEQVAEYAQKDDAALTEVSDDRLVRELARRLGDGAEYRSRLETQSHVCPGADPAGASALRS